MQTNSNNTVVIAFFISCIPAITRILFQNEISVAPSCNWMISSLVWSQLTFFYHLQLKFLSVAHMEVVTEIFIRCTLVTIWIFLIKLKIYFHPSCNWNISRCPMATSDFFISCTQVITEFLSFKLNFLVIPWLQLNFIARLFVPKKWEIKNTNFFT